MKRLALFCTRLFAGVVILVIGACATTDTANAPKNMDGGGARETVGQWLAAMESNSTDAVMAFYSDAFKNDAYPNKAAVRDAVEQSRVLGMLDGLKTDDSGATLSELEDRVVVGPVKLVGGFGTHALNVVLVNENGAWKIISAMDVAANTPAAL